MMDFFRFYCIFFRVLIGIIENSFRFLNTPSSKTNTPVPVLRDNNFNISIGIPSTLTHSHPHLLFGIPSPQESLVSHPHLNRRQRGNLLRWYMVCLGHHASWHKRSISPSLLHLNPHLSRSLLSEHNSFLSSANQQWISVAWNGLRAWNGLSICVKAWNGLSICVRAARNGLRRIAACGNPTLNIFDPPKWEIHLPTFKSSHAPH